ncbi:hypothetical protein EV361DRAFT_930278 [Lentinula raphanica]|nr:hypothetical protein EV361DRAFT_930278 [Lentinula raphanica]
MEAFFRNVPAHNLQPHELTFGHLQDPDNCYLDLALDYDLSMLTMPVRDWRDGTNDVVPMRDYSNVFTPSTKVYVECKLQLYNIVEGPGKRAIVRPSRVASAIIDHIRVLPNDEAGIRLMYIESARTAKDNEDRDREQEREAKEQRERDIERERKRVADENASLAAENERKKRKLDLARRGLSTSVSPRKEIDSVPGPSMADPTVSSTVPAVASSSSSPQKGVVGTRMSTGGKPPRKAVSKGKSARALEKERADDHGEDPVNSDIEMGANL